MQGRKLYPGAYTFSQLDIKRLSSHRSCVEMQNTVCAQLTRRNNSRPKQ